MTDNTESVIERTEYDRDRLAIQRERLELERRHLALRERELDMAEKRPGASRWSNPLVLALVGLIGTALGGTAVALISRDSSIVVENNKHNYQLTQNAINSAREVFAEISKQTNIKEICRRIEFLKESNFTENQVFISAIDHHLRKCSSAGYTSSVWPRLYKPLQSGWINGGSNPAAECQKIENELRKDPLIVDFHLTGSSEVSRKSFWGHVQYNYTCIFDVTPSAARPTN